MNKYDFTHYARFYGIPSYFNIYTNELMGRNLIYQWLLGIMIWIEQNFPSNPYGFPIEVLGEIED